MPNKPCLESAPYIIAVFAERYGRTTTGERRSNYYVNESVGIATGFLLAALHHAGLVALTHTPNPMGFLSELLERPANERPIMMIVTGYPAEDAEVPSSAPQTGKRVRDLSLTPGRKRGRTRSPHPEQLHRPWIS